MQIASLQEPADVMREEQRVPGATVGPLSCHLPLLHAASDSSEPMGLLAGSKHTAKTAKEFPGPEEQKRPGGPGRMERPMRCGRDSKDQDTSLTE